MFSKQQILSFQVFVCLAVFSLNLQADCSAVVDVTAQNFEQEVLKADLPVIVKISATWCPPCQKLKPMFEIAAAKFQDQCKFVAMDFDQNPDFVKNHKIEVVPTFIIYYKGQDLVVMPGCPPNQEELEKFIQQIISFVKKNY